MKELPHIAATGAQKQFKDFMNNKNFDRGEITFSSYKTIIGVGLLFKRIKKLCGTANGNVYPSLTVDPITNTHAPVAMSTAIYTTAYIHKVTNGLLDYWSFYNYKYNLVKAINNNKRIDSDLDSILVEIIKSCWIQIAKFGGAAAQEKTKLPECWRFVKSNILISSSILSELDKFCITEEEKIKRESISENSDDLEYFKNLDLFLDNKGEILQLLLSIANTNTEYFSEKKTLLNFIKKINSGSLLPMKRVEEIKSFYDLLINQGFELNANEKGVLDVEVNLKKVFNDIFKNKDKFLEKLYESYFDEDNLEEEHEKKYNDAKDIIEKYYREYGLSIADIIRIDDISKNH
jgi:hypothetical protein